MTEPTTEFLLQEIAKLNERINQLSTDPIFGITTRPAVDAEYRQIKDQANYLVFIDVDNLHEVNSNIGHEQANENIKSAVNIRSSDVLLRSRWYSGDELIFILVGDPDGFCQRLQYAFHQFFMSATMCWVKSTGDLHADVYSAKHEVDTAKANGVRGAILRVEA